jgi:PAS domain S-box-containing protein
MRNVLQYGHDDQGILPRLVSDEVLRTQMEFPARRRVAVTRGPAMKSEPIGLIDALPGLVWTALPDGEVDFLSRSWCEFTGLSADRPNGVWQEAVHPADLPALLERWQSILASGQSGELEARLRRSDGQYRWFLFRSRPLTDATGQVAKWCGIGIDIDERRQVDEARLTSERQTRLTDIEDRKRAEDALRQNETLLAEGQRISSTGTYAWSGDPTERMFLSEEFYRIFEYDLDTVVTFARLRERFHPEDLPLLDEKIEQIAARRENPEWQIRLRMPDGRIKHVRVIGRVIHHPDGRLERIGAVQDVTQRQRAEDARDKVRTELSHVTRVMSLGALTASIAHEVNQPLAAIVTNAGTCLRMLLADPPNIDGACETARRAIRDGNRAAEVIGRLHQLFSRQTTATEMLDLSEATRDVIALLSSDLQRNRVILRTELDDELPRVTGDRVQLQQVIMNLIRNASDAMGEVDHRPRQMLIKTSAEQDCVSLAVTDTGVGLEPESAAKLFDAFYTTKSAGMGIGLSISRSIIESHGGQLWAKPNDGPGATFSFLIPRQAASAEGDDTVGVNARVQPSGRS